MSDITTTARSAHVQILTDAAPEQPEHRGERRRFLIWALMLGATKPEIVTERIVADIESEADA